MTRREELQRATVEIAATLSVPDGYGSHDERRLVRCCAGCATFILTRQYVPTWDWDRMRVDTRHGDYGWCYQCPDTAARARALEAVAS